MRLKHFLSVFLTLLTLSVGQMWGADETWTQTFTSAGTVTITNNATTLNGKSWSIATTTGKGSPACTSVVNGYSKSGWQFGSNKDNYYSAVTLSTSAFSSYSVKSVTVVIRLNAGVSTTVAVSQGSTNIGSNTVNTSNTWHTLTANTTAGTSGNLSIAITTSQAFFINSISVVYASGPTTYTVTYYGNGNTGGSVPTDATKYNTGTTVTVKDNTGSLAKSGWTFAGWNKNNTGTGTNYAAGSGTFSISANTTLYAKWTRTVTWSVNGATNVYSASTVTYNPSGSKVSSLPTAPNPASYCGDKFVGWTTDAEYVHGTSPLFTTAASSPDLNSITTDVIFYAVFADYDE